MTGEKKASQLLDAINPLGASKVVSCFPHGHGELPTAGPTMPPVSWISWCLKTQHNTIGKLEYQKAMRV